VENQSDRLSACNFLLDKCVTLKERNISLLCKLESDKIRIRSKELIQKYKSKKTHKEETIDKLNEKEG
jgi:hypothetical protein